MDLTSIIKEFCEIYGRKNASYHIDRGNIRYINEQRVIFFDEKLNIKNVLRDFYEHVIINDKTFIGGVLSLQLYSDNELIKGLDGWRWFYENGQLKEDPFWLNSWIIVGNKNEDALFVKTELENCPVFGILTGSQEEIILTDNFPSFIKSLIIIMKMEKQYNYEVKLEDYSIKPDFFMKCRTALLSTLSSNRVDNFMNFFF